jgi:hypothetical protein
MADYDPDSYCQFTGEVNVAGKRIIPNEMGADLLKVYQQGLLDLYRETKRAWAVGSSQMVLHGATFTHQYPETTVSATRP